jgi:glycosyltransferase involved in cell wall biosynthesis
MNSENRILFISSSDISVDSRILKQMKAAESIGFKYLAIGIKEFGRIESTVSDNIISIDPYFRITKKQTHNRLKTILVSIIRTLFMSTEVLLKITIKSLIFKPKIIHCSDYPFLPIAVMLKFLTGAKVIYDIHELESETTGISKFNRVFVLMIEKLSWRFIDTVFYVSESIRKWYTENIGEINYEIILNAPELKVSEKKTDYIREYFKLDKDSIIFIYLGLLSRDRGIEMALEVFKLNPKYVIVFMGHGEKEEEIRKYSSKYANIFLHPAVSSDLVVPITSSANFGYCVLENTSLSVYFSLPNKLFEYVFSGLPVLASNFPDISDKVNNYNLGLVVDFNKDAIISGIEELINRDRKKISQNNNLDVLTWDYQKNKITKILRLMIA